MFYFYIVRCSDNSLYCGQTNNLQKRINEHNFDKSKTSKYTRARRPVHLEYFEEYPTLQLAMKREWQVKEWTKTKKEDLIKRGLKWNKSSGKSVSLIEILIVISLLGAFVLLVFIEVQAQLKKSRDARRKLDFNSMRNVLEDYYDTRRCYPQTLPNCNQSFVLGNTTLLASIPCDPKSKASYYYLSDGGSCSSWFKLYTNLEISTDRLIDLVGCRYGCGPNCAYNFGVSSSNVDLGECFPPPTPTPTTKPTFIPTPIPTLYVCTPASGPKPLGKCEPFAMPTLSECPKIFPNDPTCQYQCGDPANRCKNEKGKY